ncbi:MAG: GAF domain-containing protein [Pseudomonadota bacterium]
MISQAAFDLPTVLKTLLEAAARLCDGTICILFNRVGDELRLGANVGCPPEMVECHLANPHKFDRRSIAGRAVMDRKTVHIPDIMEDADYDKPLFAELGGWRSIMAVPMCRDGEVIGVFDLARPTPGPFSDRQIELVETFSRPGRHRDQQHESHRRGAEPHHRGRESAGAAEGYFGNPECDQPVSRRHATRHLERRPHVGYGDPKRAIG